MKNLKNAVLTALMIFSLTSNVSAIFNKDGNLPIHKAVKRGDLPKIKKIIEENPNSINSQNKLGQTPLMLAINYLPPKSGTVTIGSMTIDICEDSKNIKPRMIDLLIEKKADVNIVDNNGASCLHYVVRHGYDTFKYSKKLLEVGVNVNIVDNNGESVLKIISHNDLNKHQLYRDLVMLFLFYGAFRMEGEIDLFEYDQWFNEYIKPYFDDFDNFISLKWLNSVKCE